MFKHFTRKRITTIALLLVMTIMLSSCTLLSLLFQSLTMNTPFDEIVYERPSYEELRTMTDEILEAFDNDSSYTKIAMQLNKFFTAYSTFQTMYSLANICYAADTQNEEYLTECNFFTEHSILVDKCREEVLVACANSSIRERLETNLFGDSLEDFKDYRRYTNPRYLELALEEAALIEEYRVTISSAEVDGKLFWEALDAASTDEEYNRLLSEFFLNYTPTVTDIYHRMVQVRKEMAKEAGYDNYMELAGEGLGREFEISDMALYLDGMKEAILDNFPSVNSEDLEPIYRDCDEEELYTLLSALCTVLDENGGDSLFTYNYEFMCENNLSDFAKSTKKENSSFTTYLYDYYEPYILINPTGELSDIATVYHEFGHFCEMNYTFNASNSIDLAEVYSTGLEMIALHYLDTMDSGLTEEEVNALILYEELMVYETMISQGVLSEFEMAIYDPDSEIDTSDPDQLCELYRTVANEWGYQISEDNFAASANWIAVPHIFQYPSYVFSYCISMDIALQLSNLEQAQSGDGLACYMELLDRDTSADFVTVMTDAGLASPFEDDHFASLFSDYLSKQKSAA